MSTNKANVLDNLPARFIKNSACVTAKMIMHIVNLSISRSTFPKDLKTARVVPLQKSSKTNVGNYRPVSIPLGVPQGSILGPLISYTVPCESIWPP
jgi:hypothetical protein